MLQQRHTEITAQLLVLWPPLIITKTSLTFASSLLPNPKIPIHPINQDHEWRWQKQSRCCWSSTPPSPPRSAVTTTATATTVPIHPTGHHHEWRRQKQSRCCRSSTPSSSPWSTVTTPTTPVRYVSRRSQLPSAAATGNWVPSARAPTWRFRPNLFTSPPPPSFSLLPPRLPNCSRWKCDHFGEYLIHRFVFKQSVGVVDDIYHFFDLFIYRLCRSWRETSERASPSLLWSWCWLVLVSSCCYFFKLFVYQLDNNVILGIQITIPVFGFHCGCLYVTVTSC